MSRAVKEKKITTTADDELDLPFMFLRLEAEAHSVWGTPEPQEYVVEISGDIFVLEEAGEELQDSQGIEVEVGHIELYRVNLSQAMNDGCSWDDVLDAHSQDLANYLVLLGRGSGFTDWVHDHLGNPGDMLVLHKIQIDPEHRGRGYGLLAARLAMDSLANNETLVACTPSPLLNHVSGEPFPDIEEAKKKLRNHWMPLGFKRVPKSDVLALHFGFIQAPIEQVMQSYLSKRRG